jgi:hypothetical protein
MAVIKLKAGETVLVAAVNPDLKPDNTLPGQQPKPDQGLPKPEAPVDPGYGIDLGLGVPTHPIVLPPDPTKPLPQPPRPDQTLPGDLPIPSHPIVLPPPGEIPPPIEPPAKPTPGWELKTAWTPTTGWVVVAIPTGEHVTPSKRK